MLLPHDYPPVNQGGIINGGANQCSFLPLTCQNHSCYFINPFFLAQAQIKETHANINSIKTDIISHTSKTGSSIIFDSITLTIIINGIVNKKVVPKAANFLSIRLNTATINHKNTIEATAIIAPIENTSFVFNKLPNKNK